MNTLPTDICANRHGGNEQSAAANAVAEPTKAVMRQRIFEAIAATPSGTTLKDLCRRFNKLPNEISGRISELKGLGLVVATDDPPRERCAVLVAVVK